MRRRGRRDLLVLLAVVVASVGDNPGSVVVAVGGIVVYVLVVAGPLRVIFGRLLGGPDRRGGTTREMLVLVTILVLLGAAFTDSIGVYSVFGAFLSGSVMPSSTVATSVLLPMFFTYAGLRTQLSLLADPYVVLVTMITVLVGHRPDGDDDRDDAGRVARIPLGQAYLARRRFRRSGARLVRSVTATTASNAVPGPPQTACPAGCTWTAGTATGATRVH